MRNAAKRSDDIEPDQPVADSLALRRLQVLVFALTWLSYASYYLTRKNLSVVKSRLHDTLGVSMTVLGEIDTLYLACYALGMFASGALGDRIRGAQFFRRQQARCGDGE